METLPLDTPPEFLPLTQQPLGQKVRVAAITDQNLAMQALRMGISEGEIIEVIARIPGGPLVIRQGELEIALGRELCLAIQVLPL
jgi:Fe2+ transport system protein FeoA